MEMILCFIDYKKTFDCADSNKSLAVLLEISSLKHLMALIKNLFKWRDSIKQIPDRQEGEAEMHYITNVFQHLWRRLLQDYVNSHVLTPFLL